MSTLPPTLFLLIFLASCSCFSLVHSLSVLPRVNTTAICTPTPHPSFCQSALAGCAAGNATSGRDYGRYMVRKSLSRSREFLSLADDQVALAGRRSDLPVSTVRALRDCRTLARQNLKYLVTSFRALKDEIVDAEDVRDVHTLLSNVLTNQDTCKDALETTDSSLSNLKNRLLKDLAHDTMLHGVSLSFFTKGWVGNKDAWTLPRWKQRKLFENGNLLPFRMPNQNMRATYESISRRKLDEKIGDQSIPVKAVVIVSRDGSGNFTTIRDAISAAPNNADGKDGYFMIYVKAGVYHEYVNILEDKKYLVMVGDGIGQTIVTGNHNHVDGWGTFRSSTFAVSAPHFIAMHMTIRNTAGPEKFQAVALLNQADQSMFYRCSFEGYQDTLYTHSSTQLYRECDIYGTVDFIFGNAAVLFDNCRIYPTLPMKGQFNAITAQGRSQADQNTGTFIQNCTIKASHRLASNSYPVQTYLGRPWKEYSRTIVSHSYTDILIHPKGWSPWDGDFALSTLYYGEYRNTGPGSNTTGRVNWPGYHVMNDAEVGRFMNSSSLPRFSIGHKTSKKRKREG